MVWLINHTLITLWLLNEWVNECFIIHSWFHFHKELLVLTVQCSYAVPFFSISVPFFSISVAWILRLSCSNLKDLLHAQVLVLMTFLLRYKVFPLPHKIPAWRGNGWSNFYHHSLVFILMPISSFVSGIFAQHNCLRFIRLLRCISNLFLFIGVLFSIVCICHYVLIHSPVDGPSVCF